MVLSLSILIYFLNTFSCQLNLNCSPRPADPQATHGLAQSSTFTSTYTATMSPQYIPNLYHAAYRVPAISAYHTHLEPRQHITFGMQDDGQWRAGATGVEIVGGKSTVNACLASLQMSLRSQTHKTLLPQTSQKN